MFFSARGHAELAAGGGHAALMLAGEGEIMRLNEEFDTGEKLRQEGAPRGPKVIFLKVGLEVRWVHLVTKDSDKMICGTNAGSTGAGSGVAGSGSSKVSG
ncbi:MAG TPA: hypothetical protein VJA21_01645 [Verrucomicrobiae bacterium]